MSNVIKINRGSDVDFSLTWPGGLVGSTVSAFEPTPALAPYLTLTIADAEAGTITGRIEWADIFPTGLLMFFRIQVSTGADDVSLPLIGVHVI